MGKTRNFTYAVLITRLFTEIFLPLLTPVLLSLSEPARSIRLILELTHLTSEKTLKRD